MRALDAVHPSSETLGPLSQVHRGDAPRETIPEGEPGGDDGESGEEHKRGGARDGTSQNGAAFPRGRANPRDGVHALLRVRAVGFGPAEQSADAEEAPRVRVRDERDGGEGETTDAERGVRGFGEGEDHHHGGVERGEPAEEEVEGGGGDDVVEEARVAAETRGAMETRGGEERMREDERERRRDVSGEEGKQTVGGEVTRMAAREEVRREPGRAATEVADPRDGALRGEEGRFGGSRSNREGRRRAGRRDENRRIRSEKWKDETRSPRTGSTRRGGADQENPDYVSRRGEHDHGVRR